MIENCSSNIILLMANDDDQPSQLSLDLSHFPLSTRQNKILPWLQFVFCVLKVKEWGRFNISLISLGGGDHGRSQLWICARDNTRGHSMIDHIHSLPTHVNLLRKAECKCPIICMSAQPGNKRYTGRRNVNVLWSQFVKHHSGMSLRHAFYKAVPYSSPHFARPCY